MYELPALNCGHCLVNTKYFGVDITHFMIVVKRVKACFGAERALVRDFGYIGPAIWCGTCNVVGGLLILAARISKTGTGLMVKA
jgi:hypothetical protein